MSDSFLLTIYEQAERIALNKKILCYFVILRLIIEKLKK